MSALGKVAVGLVAIYGAGVVVGLVKKAPLRQALAWPLIVPYFAALEASAIRNRVHDAIDPQAHPPLPPGVVASPR
jgi:hypothetical protein